MISKIFLFLCVAAGCSAATVAYTSLPYRSRADSPFAAVIQEGRGYVEDFEDREVNTPNLEILHGDISGLISVDEGDGEMDNLGAGWFLDASGAIPGMPPPTAGAWNFEIAFTLDLPGNFPTFAGAVMLGWEREGTGSVITRYFQAFDANGDQIFDSWQEALVPVINSSKSNSTRGDRFFGLYHDGGISRIMYSGPSLDHVQYAYGPIPEPATAALAWTAAGAMVFRRRIRDGR